MKEFYLGFSAGGRRSFRDVKSYRRRKRWLAEADVRRYYDALETRTPESARSAS